MSRPPARGWIPLPVLGPPEPSEDRQEALDLGLGEEGRPMIVRAQTLQRHLDCTLHGITMEGGCGGRCCTSPAFWPPRADPQADGSCHYRGPNGCEFSPEDRPIKCLLYPLLEKPDSSVMPLHFRSPNAYCKPCTGKGPMLGEALAGAFRAIGGPAMEEEVLAATREGRDAHIVFGPDVQAALNAEHAEASANILPPPRRSRPRIMPPTE